jgi:hypothetical protein
MAETRKTGDAAENDAVTATELIALALSLVWLVLAGGFFLLVPATESDTNGGSLRFVMTVLAIFMPIALIWVAAAAARAARIMREESRKMQAAVDGMRQTYLADRQARGNALPQSTTVERKLNEIAQATPHRRSAPLTANKASPLGLRPRIFARRCRALT